ncbi:MAG TPA: hypothetical protein VIY49_32620 [Bryobacteraceae bacterium]
MKKPASAQQILAEQGYIILTADVAYPLGSMIPLADCGPDYERIPGPMVVIGGRFVAPIRPALPVQVCGGRFGEW